MKVKVTYTTDYDEVPSLTMHLVERCRGELRAAAEFKFNMLNLEETTANLRKLQEKLELVSLQLEDCVHLCHGYATAQNSEDFPSDPGVTDDKSE